MSPSVGLDICDIPLARGIDQWLNDIVSEDLSGARNQFPESVVEHHRRSRRIAEPLNEMSNERGSVGAQRGFGNVIVKPIVVEPNAPPGQQSSGLGRGVPEIWHRVSPAVELLR